MEEELVITLDIEDAKKVIWLINSGILRINGDSKTDPFDKESVLIGQDLMKDLFTEYNRVVKLKRKKK